MRIVRSTSAMVRRVTCRRIGTAALLTSDVDAAVVVPDLQGQVGSRFRLRQVGRPDLRVGGGGEAVVAHRLEAVGPPGHQRHGVAPAGEGPGERGADAR